MTTPPAPSPVPLFLGYDPVDDGEQRLIPRLREDLQRRGVAATLHANATAGKRGQQRQVDLIVRTPSRVVVCEIKTWDPRLPVVGPLNGPWRQLIEDGRPLVHDGNAAQQAIDATYAVSDSMRKLARSGRVSSTPNGNRFYRYIDTVVCMFERIPEGSNIERRDHVEVIGYSRLVDLICSERSRDRLEWTDGDWDNWVRDLGLYQRGSSTEEAMGRAVRVPEVGQARARLVSTLTPATPERVSTGVQDPNGDRVGTDRLHDEVSTGGDIVLEGPSGSGKSLLGTHLALQLTNSGRLVAMVRCGDYEGRLSSLLARSFAPYSSADHRELLASAVAAGVGITVVLDEFDRCPPDLAQKFSEQLSAFKLRTGCSVVLTTTGPTPPSMSSSTTYKLLAPSADERLAILVAHGARHPQRLRDLFDTPFELAIAAAAESELSEDASQVELFDAYIRKLVPSELQRSRLRGIARDLHDRLIASVPVVEVTATLARWGASAEEIDTLLDCKVLTTAANRVRFSHEQLQRFLTAEDVAREMPSGADLGRFLTAPPNRILSSWAVALIADGTERWTAISELADTELALGALAGRLGEQTRARGQAHLQEVLREVTQITEQARVRPPTTPGMPFLHWDLPRDLARFEACLLAATGSLLGETGECDSAVLALIDATDQLCWRSARELATRGIHGALSPAVGGAYAVISGQGQLPTQLVFSRAQMAGWRRAADSAPALVDRVLAGPGDHAWGRFLLAAQVANPDHAADVAALPSLIQRGWTQDAYHVRLELLEAASRFALVDEPARAAIVDALQGLDTEGVHFFLGSTLVEALAAFGAIEPIATLGDIEEEVAAVLAHGDDPQAAELAASMVDSQFEDEAIVGPYSEVIGGLPVDTQAAFLCLAARAVQQRMWTSWTLHRLADLAEEAPSHRAAIRAAVERHAAQPDREAFQTFEAAAAWEAAVRAWAWCADEPHPEWNGQPSIWAELGRTLFLVHREGQVGEPVRRLVEFGADAVQALFDLHRAQMFRSRDNPAALSTIEKVRPEEVRELLRWAVRHPEQLGGHFAQDLLRFAIDGLGRVGTKADMELLREWTVDPECGAAASAAIVAISGR